MNLVRVDRSRTLRPWLLLAGLLAGCGSAPEPERTGAEMRREFPEELSALLPDDAVLSHSESAEVEIPYRLWIVRRERGENLELPKTLRGVERHDLPASILVQFLKEKTPQLDLGTPTGKACRYTHWEAPGCEYQARELVTDRGWFATLERIGK